MSEENTDNNFEDLTPDDIQRLEKEREKLKKDNQIASDSSEDKTEATAGEMLTPSMPDEWGSMMSGARADDSADETAAPADGNGSAKAKNGSSISDAEEFARILNLEFIGQDALAELAATERMKSGLAGNPSGSERSNGQKKVEKNEVDDVKITDDKDPPFWSF